MKKVVQIMLWCGLFTLLVGASLYAFYQQQLAQHINIEQVQLFEVRKGQSARSVFNDLLTEEVIENTWPLRLAMKLDGQRYKLKAAVYELKPSTQYIELLNQLSSGKGKQFSITLVEGHTWREWQAKLMAAPYLTKEELTESRLLQQVLSPYSKLEGLLMPDTYNFEANSHPTQIVLRAHQAMQDYLTSSWQSREQGLPYETQYEALIMASIVEKETGLASERPHIAGVFVNRLRKRMRLQTDPTVIYGIGESFNGNITRQDLRTATPYNTYVIKGLPPTPISMVSREAIDAVLHPMTTDDLYFVSKGDGSHQFSQSLEEHNQAVRKYQLNQSSSE